MSKKATKTATTPKTKAKRNMGAGKGSKSKKATKTGAGSKKRASVAEQSPPETSGSSQNPILQQSTSKDPSREGKALWGKLKTKTAMAISHQSLRVRVTGCHTLYSVLTFCVSSLFPLLHLHAYLDEHYQLIEKNYGLMKFEEFWSFNFTPLTFWALLISFMLQPCNKSKWHKAMLYVQYVVYSFSFTTSYFNFFGRSVVMLIVTIFLLVLLLFATLTVRSIVASLDPKKLSEFLSKSVIYKGLLLGSIKLTFLVFTSIKCETELREEEEKSDLEQPWRACNRTLYSQTGLGIMIIIYLTLTVLSGIASTSVREDHTVNLKKAWTMDMDFAESVQCCGISLSAFLAIYLAGNYGAEGDFRSELDRNLIYLAAWIGSLSLLFSQIPAAFKVWKEQESEKLKQEIAALKAENANLKAKLPSEEPPKQEETLTKESVKGLKVQAEDLVKNETPGKFVEGKSKYMNGKITCVHKNGTVDIDYDINYCTEVRVKPEYIRTLVASPFEPTVGLEVEVRSGKSKYVGGEITVVHQDGTVDVKYKKDELVRALEASSFWTTIAILITSVQSTLVIAGTITLDDFYTTLSTILFPFTAVLVFGAWFCQPQREDTWKICLHFASYAYVGECSNIIWSLRLDDLPQAGYHLGRAVLWTLILKMVFKIREFLNDLEPKKLEEFLRSTICDKGLTTLSLILFLTFRTTKCAAEEGSISECAETATCSMWISIYLVFGWLALIVDGAVPEELTSEYNLTCEKIAEMKIRRRQFVQGALALITILCGLFLFSLMSTNSNNEDVATTIFVVGIGGGSFAFLVFMIELWCAFSQREELKKKREELREELKKEDEELNQDEDEDDLHRSVRVLSDGMRAHSQSLGGYWEDAGEVNTNIIEEVWSGYIFFIFLATSAYSALIIMWAFTGEDKWWMYAFVIGPIAFLPFTMSILMKPKKTWKENKLYMAFLYFHFVSFLVVSEAAVVVFYISNDTPIKASFAVVRLSGWIYIFWKGMLIRKSASVLLKERALSEFLARDVFKNGVKALVPCLFFTFETVACLIDQDNIEDGQCENTSMASFYLSAILSMLLVMSVVEKALPVGLRELWLGWEMSHIATLKLKRRQGAQGFLLLLASVSSLYLLSCLGVEGEYSSMLSIISTIGVLSALLALVIHVNVMSLTYYKTVGEAKGLITRGASGSEKEIKGRLKEVEERFKETSATARLSRSESA
eukprot:CAMPEP_0182514400 /NCGR_PEP_ID=MMETSP1321-20130603/35669_1 /TAXON_ID=91990 /ORGANISM="Bolidomonas sp., Strain RCC1657" /LENGTH=1209 /DNA_ID=CAMNT_0024721593 /DNA_START=151 /DNA_END=3777 /DNA_ORIENTATION=+